MKYELFFDSAVVNLPASVMDKLPDIGECELKLLLCLSHDKEILEDFENNEDKLCAYLGVEKSELESALSYWRGTGIIKSADKKKGKKRTTPRSMPTYTGVEIEEIVDNNNLSEILSECQRITGKLYNQTEASKIAALNSYLNLDAEFILLLFQYCSDNNHSSLRYIEKTAYSLFDMGIDTTEKLEAYIIAQDERNSLEGKLRSMFGWGERKLTPTETKHITSWVNDFHYGIEVIEEAYNITVEKTGKLSLPYLSKILSNWYEHGYKTIEDIHRALAAYEADKLSVNNKKSDSFDVDEFFELSLKRSREKIEK